MIKKEGHVHKFKGKYEKRILVNAGLKTSHDIIKYSKCKCGVEQSYDLEREIK